MSVFINYFPRPSSMYFSDAVNNNLNVLSQADLAHQQGQHMATYGMANTYLQKWVNSDPITIQMISNCSGSGLLEITLCDNYQNEITSGGITTALNIAPIFKGVQLISGDTFPGVYGIGAGIPLYRFMWNFILSTYTIPASPFYYIKIRISDGITADVMFSEPFILYPATLDQWGNLANLRSSLLFTSQYKANRSQNTNIVVSGWWNDYPTNTQPYFPVFNQRFEGFILPDDPLAINQGYLMQQYQQSAPIAAQQIPRMILKLGEASLGVPQYALEMITEALLADTLSITNYAPLYYGYKLWNPSGQSTPTGFWKTKRDDSYPLLYASAPLTLGELSQQFMITPTPVPAGRYHDASHDSSHN